jgi:hypothetical protein
VTAIRIGLAVALALFAGLGLLSRLDRGPRSGIGALGLGFVIGVLAVALWTHLLLWVRIPVNLGTILAGPLAMGCCGRWSFTREWAWIPLPRTLLLAAAASLFLLWGALSSDDLGWDPEALYRFKAGSIVHHGTIWNEDFTDPDRPHIARRRPLLLPAIYADFTLLSGTDAVRPLRLWFVLFQIAAFGAMYDVLRRRLAPAASALVVGCYAWLPLLFLGDGGVAAAWADPALAMIFLLALASEAPLAGFFLAAGALLKDEGTAFILVFALTRSWKTAVIPAVISGAWMVTARSLPPDFAYFPQQFSNPHLEMLPVVAREIGRHLVTWKHWSILWIGFAVFLAMRIRKLDREDARWLLPVSLLFAIYVGVWTTFDRGEIARYVGIQGHRLLLHVTPILLTWAAWRAEPAPPIRRNGDSPAAAGS